MIKKIKELVMVLALVFVPAVAVVSPAAVYAADEVNIEGNLDKGTCLNTTNCPADEDPEEKINGLIADILNLFSLIIGVVAVIMIIVGGFKYITSSGEDKNVASAKNTIMYAIIGLVIVALAQFIVRFVLGRVTE